MIRFEPTPKGLLLTALAIALAWLTLALLPVALVLIVALMLVGTLNPLVEWLEAHHWKRGLAIALVFTSMFVTIIGLLAVTIPSLIEQVAALAKE
jgi:predicted PurR-regulated permease PerM